MGLISTKYPCVKWMYYSHSVCVYFIPLWEKCENKIVIGLIRLIMTEESEFICNSLSV